MQTATLVMDLEEVLVPIAFFLSVVAIAKILADYRARKKLIEKGIGAEEARAVLSSVGGSSRESSLKWGLVAASVGMGLVVVDLASFESGPIVPGIVLLFAGAALVGHYLLRREAPRRPEASAPTPPAAGAGHASSAGDVGK